MLYLEQKLQHPSPSLGHHLSCWDGARELFKGGKTEVASGVGSVERLHTEDASGPNRSESGCPCTRASRTGTVLLWAPSQASVLKEQRAAVTTAITPYGLKPELRECAPGSLSYSVASASAVGKSSAEFCSCNSLFKSANSHLYICINVCKAR